MQPTQFIVAYYDILETTLFGNNKDSKQLFPLYIRGGNQLTFLMLHIGTNQPGFLWGP